ncbi:basic form of pathogenesis-related protein 1-like protein [Tanacetum coccineum]
MELVSIKSLAFFLLIIQFCINLLLASQLDFLIPHNEGRAQVGVQPLTWNKTLESYARRYAYQRLEDCDLQHSEGPYGENLAVGFGDQFTTNEAVNMWLGERQYYELSAITIGGLLFATMTHQGIMRDNALIYVDENIEPQLVESGVLKS